MHAVLQPRREEALPLPGMRPEPADNHDVHRRPDGKLPELEIPYPLPDDEEADRRRLNAGHYALKSYLGSNYIAPLRSCLQAPSDSPKRILDLGTGSGIWAIEMSEEFPHASVLGVDITPVVSRHVPSNCSFQVANLALEWPFPQGAFDVIHSRFCLVHLPEPKTVLQSLLRSLKPGGYLLLEEGTNALFASPSPNSATPIPSLPEGITTFYEIYGGIMRPQGVDGEVGPKMLGWIRESGQCEVVCERMLEPPMRPFTADTELNKLGETLKQFLIKGYGSMPPRLSGQGLTREVVEGFVKGVNDERHEVRGRLNWVWARKKGANC